jgi:hypothetical protein
MNEALLTPLAVGTKSSSSWSPSQSCSWCSSRPFRCAAGRGVARSGVMNLDMIYWPQRSERNGPSEIVTAPRSRRSDETIRIARQASLAVRS